MEGLLIFIGFLVTIIVIVARTGTVFQKLDALQKKFNALTADFNLLKSELQLYKKDSPVGKEEKPIVMQEKIEPPVLIKEPVLEKKETPVEKPPVVDEHKPEPVLEKTKVEEIIIQPKPQIQPKKPIEKKPGFFEKNPDLEKFIGENLINKIGIAILVIGIGFFVKFAIDKDWINEVGRVFIGILCGGILVGFAHYMRNTFRSFSSVLVGGGMAIFYITIAIAFHEYKIFSQEIAFAIMVLITIFSVVLSIAYDRKELAVLALIGGFASPFMVSTGSGNYKVLFTYVLILDIGMLVLSYFKRWNIINVISFIFTALLFSGWLTKVYSSPEVTPPHAGAMVFATLFYLTFFLMNILNNIKENKKFLAFEISLLLANTALYYTAGMVVFYNINEGLYQGLFTVAIAIFNFLFAFTLYKNKKVDLNLVYMLIGLVLSFITLAAPIQLNGNHITLFWSVEAVLLLWLSQKSGIRIMKLGALIVMFLMVISLVMDWSKYSYQPEILNIIFNKLFVTTLCALASITGTIFLMKNEGEEIFGPLTKRVYAVVLEVLFILISYVGGLLEVVYQFDQRMMSNLYGYQVTPVYTACYNIAYVLGISFYLQFKKINWMEYISIGLSVIISLAYLVYYNTELLTLRSSWLLQDSALGSHYLFHYVNIVLLIIILANSVRLVVKNYTKDSKEFNLYLWFLCFVLIFISSAELENIVLMASYEPGDDMDLIKHHNYKVGFPILWGVFSFAVMAIGMKLKIKMLRIISLTLFSLTLLKMFIFDVREMSEGGKIAAFISLGVLLLIVSFMYQKVKKLLTEE